MDKQFKLKNDGVMVMGSPLERTECEESRRMQAMSMALVSFDHKWCQNVRTMSTIL